ncbi:MAG: methyltransferase domain-containing protein [Chloroflexi bacterium]|nr:methyltransferase domain-containing protein [Chloroflexota bacterium]MYF81843.1 methyltransferase domain-containing protein [Chloroflexota bacterium]MYI05725.1 methyltransferase domain-containing protein [Chloroflexota bacterium]
MSDASTDRYTHGHHESVVQSHARRRAEVEAWFLLPRLGPGMSLLDAGCGPGTVTTGLARTVSPGNVVGLDAAPGVLEHARGHAQEERVDNVTFIAGDVYALDFPEGAFDVVYANQLLQHLADPVRAISEMRRVLKPGGLLAVRDADYATMSPHPKFPEFLDWNELYHRVAYRNHAEPDAGRTLPAWVRAAGFLEVEIHPNVVAMDGEEARIWGRSWSQRILYSGIAEQALEHGLAEQSDLERISRGWATWAESDQPFFMFTQIAVLATR